VQVAEARTQIYVVDMIIAILLYFIEIHRNELSEYELEMDEEDFRTGGVI
jgi:hypothetical protein